MKKDCKNKTFKTVGKAFKLSLMTKSKLSLVLSVLGFAMACLPAYIAKIFAKFTDLVQNIYYGKTDDLNQVIDTLILLAILFMVEKTYAFLQGYTMANDSIDTNHYIRKKTLDYRCSVKYKYVENFDGFNEKVAFVNTHTGYKVANSIQTVILWLQNLVTFFTVTYVLVKVSPLIIAILLVTAIPAAILSYLQKDENYKHNVKWMQQGELVIHYFLICAGDAAMEEIRHLKIYDYLKARWRAIADEYIEKKNKMTCKHVLYNSAADLLRNMVYIIILMIVVYGIYHHNGYGLGTFILVYSMAGQLQKITTRLIVEITEFNSDLKYMNDFFDLDDLEYEEDASKAGRYDEVDIHFENVSFSYPNSAKKALHNININIKQGEKIAIVGENGSGKTTFINLMCGLYAPDDGIIKINGEDIQNNIPKVRNTISVVFQDFGKYDGTLRDNITIADLRKEIKDEEILRLAEIIDADSVIKAQKDKLDSNLGILSENSNNISGGQWQKVALLRALYRDQVAIMILDEPTAALDPIAEAGLYRNFNKITQDKTVLLISHRLGITSIVDRILVFNDGEIIEDGTHEELAKLNGKYRDMYDAQAQWYV
jgi:ATP-binding cassette subfamily B protein